MTKKAIGVAPTCPMPMISRYLGVDDPLWLAGPWKTVVKAATAVGWTARAVVARGHTLDSRGHVGALTDSLSVRCWLARPDGTTDRAVALWQRATWPVLGRGRAEGDDGDRGEGRGEGRATNEGKTWLWHPPMPLPGLDRVEPSAAVWAKWRPPLTPPALVAKDPLAVSWKAAGRWIWSAPIAPQVRAVPAAEFTAWLKRVPEAAA